MRYYNTLSGPHAGAILQILRNALWVDQISRVCSVKYYDWPHVITPH